MSSEIDICNLALAHLGDSATVASIAPPENSAQAAHCARFYPMARDRLLSMHSWGFAVRRNLLAPMDNEIQTTTWAYTYAAPNQMLTMLAVLADDATEDGESQPFEQEAKSDGSILVLTNQAEAVGRYTKLITDTTKFSQPFVDCLSWLLASDLAGPIIKGDAGTSASRSCYAIFRERFMLATRIDSGNRRAPPDHAVGWLTARA